MSKIFTITEGLENMGAMRTGGQGSVYKGRRVGPIITAVKLLPTPIHTESEDDKNFKNFQNEVEKLKRVNQEPNPNIVKILNSGITDSGSFPFIEMEFIEGPDLEELLKPPHEKIFTIKETIKVAEHLANALSHCHKFGVKHGDIKSNNVKFNIHSCNYVLLDFGLAIMSDEQRRTSMRHAGAIEFMAPEQNEGKMLFQTDIYSFGIILYELLAGQVPFPLNNNGETARNMVMVAHMEKPVPDLLELRKKNLPESWSAEKKAHEMQVPRWLLNIINKCLEKLPEKRFANGIELQDTIGNDSITTINTHPAESDIVAIIDENERLKLLVLNYQTKDTNRENRPAMSNKETVLDQNKVQISRLLLSTILVLLFLFAGATIYLLNGHSKANPSANSTSTAVPGQSNPTGFNQSDIDKRRRVNHVVDSAIRSEIAKSDTQHLVLPPTTTPDSDANDQGNEVSKKYDNVSATPVKGKKYQLAVQAAYLYDQPKSSTRSKAYIEDINNPLITASDERNGFVYIMLLNSKYEITKGWLRKADLIPVADN